MATGLENLEGLRVLDVGCGQGNCLEFLTHHFNPEEALGIDTSGRQIATAKSLAIASENASHLFFMQADATTMAQTLRAERRYDLILCIESWNMLDDHLRFLHQARELLNQTNEQDQAPSMKVQAKHRLVIADVFNRQQDEQVRQMLDQYFQIEEDLDFTVNVKKSGIKELDR